MTELELEIQRLRQENDDLRKKIKEQDWISVNERLPETIPCIAGTAYSEAVVVLTTGKTVLTAIFDGNEFIADGEFWEANDEEITHWKPVLPLPNTD